MAVARQGRSRPLPPPASSTIPYLASWRRWKDMLAELSPRSSAARVAVSGPSTRSSPTRDSRIGWARARSARGSRSRLTERFAGRPAGSPAARPPPLTSRPVACQRRSPAGRSSVGESSPIDAKIALQRLLGKAPGAICKAFFASVRVQAGRGLLAESPQRWTTPGRQRPQTRQRRQAHRGRRTRQRRRTGAPAGQVHRPDWCAGRTDQAGRQMSSKGRPMSPVAVVTGASSGIGAATAVRLADAG